jgi:hypothetical protein
VLQRLHDRSATFRLQCARLAGAANLSVTLRLNPLIPSRCRAFTIIRRRGWQLRAEVHLPPGHALTELIAHEFEHVLEQVEGQDLRVLARTRGSGVREIDGDMFETDRAVRVGRVVAHEAERRPNAPAAD